MLLGPGADDVAELLGIDLLALLEHHEATGKVGEVFVHPVLRDEFSSIVLLGLGDQTVRDFRRAGASLSRALGGRSSVATTIAALADDEQLEALIVGAMLGAFSFHWRSGGPEKQPLRRVVLSGVDPDRQPVLERAIAIGGAGWRSRQLASVPSNLKNPQWLADQAANVAAEAGLKLKVWDEQDLAREGFGGLVAVGQGSATPPRLIQLTYAPRKGARKAPHVVVVGKGITFDTGGLSIKPGESMVNMKRDMTGGGVVLALMGALEAVGCPVRVTGLVAAAENAISGSSFRPGDVIRHYGGRTTEVTNTDAEGRLVLADAMAYAVADLEPDVLVDIATLTGAMKVALGQRTGGFFATNDALAAAVRSAGEAAGEPLWRFPLASAYEDKLASKVADADNGAGNPGSITAALFLQHFAGDLPWAHIDVASVGDSPSESFEWTTGPTGFGVRALLAWLGRPDPLEGIV